VIILIHVATVAIKWHTQTDIGTSRAADVAFAGISAVVTMCCGRGRPGKYHLGQTLAQGVRENRQHEFKNKRTISVAEVCKHVTGFLNSEGGTLYYGIDDQRVVRGVALTEQEIDRLRQDIQSGLQHACDVADVGLFQLEFVPVTARAACGFGYRVVPGRYVVELQAAVPLPAPHGGGQTLFPVRYQRGDESAIGVVWKRGEACTTPLDKDVLADALAGLAGGGADFHAANYQRVADQRTWLSAMSKSEKDDLQATCTLPWVEAGKKGYLTKRRAQQARRPQQQQRLQQHQQQSGKGKGTARAHGPRTTRATTTR
jgi:hypothetical protein